MSEKKYAVTEAQLKALMLQVESLHGRLALQDCVWHSWSTYINCVQEEVKAPQEDWRKKWKPLDIQGREVIWAGFMPDQENWVYLCFDRKINKIDGFFSVEISPYASLVPIEPVIKKVPLWVQIHKKTGKLYWMHSSEYGVPGKPDDIEGYATVCVQVSYEAE